MEIDAFAFWRRVDGLLIEKKKDLGALCSAIGYSYSTVNSQRTRHALPKLEQCISMARYLSVSVEFLTIGEPPSHPFSDRAMTVAIAFDKAPDIDKDYIEQRILGISPPGKNTVVSSA